jgi:hypothetical protein
VVKFSGARCRSLLANPRKGEPLQLHSEERGIVLPAGGRLRADGNAKHPRRGGVSSRV